MTTNLEIDENLIKEALELGGHPTKNAVVEEALREYIYYMIPKSPENNGTS
ncbi:type II toxin-antitoxin system VapB family antitoxin [Nostoc sp. ChiQUE01b]|uniref:type II toxin-antitoxin system VapB family antitoxin n=1 Tax=Nostoc sp. ChiQUE01b TaxID=3075376 RepID=UPI002AD48E07|nr:type II toxin-antitoxin system VapB family antitoxin [Nostoc sp. ChiQUE01b]MDZ8259772.1 type II toxin-antitoxin system VapB family antitoxin [Nostoc sp. ChiQUE01b]